VIAESIPGEVRNDPVILMPVIAKMGEDKIGFESGSNLTEPILDGGPFTGEITFPKCPDPDLFLELGPQEILRAALGLPRPLAGGTENDPADFELRDLRAQFHERAAAADFYVVAVGAKAEHAFERSGIQGPHVFSWVGSRFCGWN
jgi:hypothetical protein